MQVFILVQYSLAKMLYQETVSVSWHRLHLVTKSCVLE